MSNKLSITGLLLSVIVCGFLILEWFSPTSSLTLLVSMMVMAIVGFTFAVMGIKQNRSAMSMVSMIVGTAAAGLISLLFLAMFIMGLGE